MKKICSFLLVFTMLFCCLPSQTAAASEREYKWKYKWSTRSREGDWEYAVKAGEAVLIRCHSTKKTVTAPSSIGGYKVTAIFEDAWLLVHNKAFFKGRKVKKFILPDTITHLEANAFMCDKQLEVLVLGKNLEKIRFSETDVTSDEIGFPPSLERIKVDPANKYYSSKGGVLYNKNKTKLIRYPSAKGGKTFKVPKSVRKLSDYAFGKLKHLRTLKLNDGLKGIKSWPFGECKNLKNITIPKSVKCIYDKVFYNNMYNKRLKLNFTVYKDSYAHKYLKKNGFKKIKVI